MISVVDKYYRRIKDNVDNLKIKFDISSLLVKSKEHDSKIEDIENDINNIGVDKIKSDILNNYSITQVDKKILMII